MTVILARRALTVAALALVFLVPAGCEKVHRGISSSVSPCFRVLPQAHAAVGAQGVFVSVARLRGDKINQAFPQAPAKPPQGDTRDVCVVAYRGTFVPAKIQHLVGTRQQGTFALVFVGVRTQQVRAVLLSDTLPPPLHGH